MNKKISSVLFIATLTLISACGKHSGGRSHSTSFAEEQVTEGSYRAILRPMNNSLSGFIPTGVAEVKIEGDMVNVKTLLDDDARVPHMQHIYSGTRCPTPGDDKNKDGIVDAVEARAVVGNVLISLDDDLSSDKAGEKIYPVGRGFTYIESAPLKDLLNDVHGRLNQSLGLGGHVVLIHGTSPSPRIPQTLATLDGMSPTLAVPVVCGILQREE